MSERDYPPLEVLCSCGKTTVMRWDGRKWEADDPAWVYGARPEGSGAVETLWSCGEPGHWQRNVRGMREPAEARKP
jgi:hypothetical protein